MKKKLAIVSILKPVDDPRNYKKIGISLAETNKYEVNIIGFTTTNIPAYPNITFFPLFSFERLSIRRFFTSWKIYKTLLKVKPYIIIANTHETLIVTSIYKIIFGGKILYDVQEDYYKNLISTQAFPFPLKYLLAAFVRIQEKLISRFIDHFLLAERCYRDELSFIGRRYTIVENKYVPEATRSTAKSENGTMKLVYSGTIAEEYGVFDAISFVRLLQKEFPHLHLLIIGFCPNSTTWKKLQNEVKNSPFIEISGGDRLVPHTSIVKAIKEADFALLPYRTNTYYSNRIPTKLYECLYEETPVITRENPFWQPLFDEFDGFVFSDFHHVDEKIINQLKERKFFTKGNKKSTLWDSEKTKLVEAINSLI